MYYTLPNIVIDKHFFWDKVGAKPHHKKS